MNDPHTVQASIAESPGKWLTACCAALRGSLSLDASAEYFLATMLGSVSSITTSEHSSATKEMVPTTQHGKKNGLQRIGAVNEGAQQQMYCSVCRACKDTIESFTSLRSILV